MKNVLNALAARHLLRNKKQALSAFLAIVLAVSILVAIATFCFGVYGEAAAQENAGGADGLKNAIIVMGVLLGGIISAASVIVIANAFAIQAGERAKQFGILKSVGATEKQIKKTIVAESNLFSLVSIPTGIAAGYALCFAAAAVIKAIDGTVDFPVKFNVFAVLLAAVLGYVTTRAASLQIAGKVSKLSAIESIRRTDDIKTEAKDLKTPKIVGKIFGFEGVLAYKQMKRNKRKFRVTVISLVSSIVLFLSAFSLGDMLLRTALGAYANTGANVVSSAEANSADTAKFDRYEAFLKSKNPDKIDVVYVYRHRPANANGTSAGEDWYNIMAMNDGDYDAYCDGAGVPRGSNILLTEDDKTVPFNISFPGVNLTVTAKTTATNTYLKAETMTSYPNIIIPRSVMQSLSLGVTAKYFIVTPDAGGFIAEIADAGTTFGFTDYGNYNTDEATKELKRTYTVLMFFVYAFIGMVTLIGATSVLATVNSGINLRKPEFASLRAVGMQSKKLYKMLIFESIFYGLKSLLIGLPLGAALSFLVYLVCKNSAMTFRVTTPVPYLFPWGALLACVAGVIVINLISMLFATSKIRRGNIVETIREINI